jgi:hypothetical protein
MHETRLALLIGYAGYRRASPHAAGGSIVTPYFAAMATSFCKFRHARRRGGFQLAEHPIEAGTRRAHPLSVSTRPPASSIRILLKPVAMPSWE